MMVQCRWKKIEKCAEHTVQEAEDVRDVYMLELYMVSQVRIELGDRDIGERGHGNEIRERES